MRLRMKLRYQGLLPWSVLKHVHPYLPGAIHARSFYISARMSRTALSYGTGAIRSLRTMFWSRIICQISPKPGPNLPVITCRCSGAVITWADLTPTLLDLAGAGPELPPPVYGRSFKEIMTQCLSAGWDEVFTSHTFHEVTMYYPMRVVRGRRYKLIWNITHGLPYPFATDLHASEIWQSTLANGLSHYGKRRVHDYLHRPEFELYDLESGPNEVRNLAGNLGAQAVLGEYQARIRTHQQRTGNPWILKWDYEWLCNIPPQPLTLGG